MLQLTAKELDGIKGDYAFDGRFISQYIDRIVNPKNNAKSEEIIDASQKIQYIQSTLLTKFNHSCLITYVLIVNKVMSCLLPSFDITSVFYSDYLKNIKIHFTDPNPKAFQHLEWKVDPNMQKFAQTSFEQICEKILNQFVLLYQQMCNHCNPKIVPKLSNIELSPQDSK